MSEPTVSHSLPRVPQRAVNQAVRVIGFLLGLILGSFPLILTGILAPLYIKSTVNRNGPYHGDYTIIGWLLLFRMIGEALTILFILLTPLLARFKHTRPASYGFVTGLILVIALPPLSYLLSSLYSLIIPSSYMIPLPSNMLAWLSLLDQFVPLIGLLLVPILALTPKMRLLSYVVAVIAAAVFFYQHPISYYL